MPSLTKKKNIGIILLIAIVALLALHNLGYFNIPGNPSHNGIPTTIIGSAVYSNYLDCTSGITYPLCEPTYVWDGTLTTSKGIDNYTKVTFCEPIAADIPEQCSTGNIGQWTNQSYVSLYLVNATSGNMTTVSQANSQNNAELILVKGYLSATQKYASASSCTGGCQQDYAAQEQSLSEMIASLQNAAVYNNNLFSATATTSVQTTSTINCMNNPNLCSGGTSSIPTTSTPSTVTTISISSSSLTSTSTSATTTISCGTCSPPQYSIWAQIFNPIIQFLDSLGLKIGLLQ